MKTKLFGPGIEDDVKNDLATLIGMSDRDLDHFASWLSGTSKPIPLAWSDVEELVEHTSLDARKADRVLAVLRYLLTNWQSFDLSLEDIERDLKSVDYSDADARKVVKLLSKLKDARDRVYRTSVKRSYEVLGVPSVDDMNIMWDVRPVFKGPIYDTEGEATAHQELIGQTYLLILEILSSTQSGPQEARSYQLSELDFDRLSQALERAKKQLEVIKKTFA